MLAIVILLWIIFRSLPAGLLGAIPLGVTLISNFGLMGWFGFELDIGNSLLSSIAIGIGVDYTIHLFWRLKYELSLGKEYTEAIMNTLRTTGRGIAINAVSVMIGFAVLFLSGLVILKTFAFLIIFSLLLCLLCALILVPAICMVARPKFLEMNGKQQLGFVNAITEEQLITSENVVIEKEFETQIQKN
jgi:predicted RND superfamily exporter protein